jgi:hypothetical protein
MPLNWKPSEFGGLDAAESAPPPLWPRSGDRGGVFSTALLFKS